MDRDYWNRVSESYQAEVMSVFDNDREGVIKERILAAGQSGSDLRAADLGCGVGRFTPLLAEAFGEVEACDYSSVGLQEARRRCRGLDNVNFHEVDLERDPAPFEPVDFVLCVNVLIMPSLDRRLRAWRAVVNQVAQGGSLLLVTPSLESAQMEFYSAVEARLSEGESCEEAVRHSMGDDSVAEDLRIGVHQLDRVRTKHYLKEELEQMLRERQFVIAEATKLVYPSDDDEPFSPWDWLVTAVRR